jgi:thiamine-phosphate pyrophosphorylase
MMPPEPTYSVQTPLNIASILTHHPEAFMKEFKILLENVVVTSVRIRPADLNSAQLIEVVECIKQINTSQIPILMENNLELSLNLKVDGVHLTYGQKLVKEAREILGKQKIIGAFCGSSKHSGLVAAEHGANYVSFQARNNTTSGNQSVLELFKWWSEFIEIPVMAECSSTIDIPRELWNYCDFFSINTDQWNPGDTII